MSPNFALHILFLDDDDDDDDDDYKLLLMLLLLLLSLRSASEYKLTD